MRAILPQGNGLWPAFWMLGNSISEVGWPDCGDINIMEFIGKDPENIYGKIHAQGLETSTPYHLAGGFSSDFHTYTAVWKTD